MSDSFEVGRLRLRLPTGAATIEGFVRGQHGIPVLGPGVSSRRPVWMGGAWTLFRGLPPTRSCFLSGTVVRLASEWRQFDSHGFSWAGVSTSDASAKAERLGWQLLTRCQAAALLTELGYQIPSRHGSHNQRYGESVLWTDQLDNLTWHIPEAVDGHRYVDERDVFVSRDAPQPLIARAALPPAS